MATGDALEILALEPYFGLSHRTFLEGYQRYSKHRIEIWSLPARKWKWRMRGSAFHFADLAERREGQYRPDAILASDFLNVGDFRSIAPRFCREVPTVLYFHENQASYPLADHAPVDFHFGWINLSSALASDHVLFNSSYHREQFLGEVGTALDKMADGVPEGLIDRVRDKSEVFPVGIDFAPHRALRRETRNHRSGDRWGEEGPTILWNHRWEYDKRPERFVAALEALAARKVPFRVIICGECFGTTNPHFERAKSTLASRIRHLGFFPDRDDYLRAVAESDIVVSTACHEFFGISVAEAIFLGCLPVLPNDLSYPEIVPAHLHPLFLYEQDSPLERFLEPFLACPPLSHAGELLEAVERFDWKTLAPELDEIFSRAVRTGTG